MKIKIYGTKICVHCDNIKSYLMEKKISFDYMSIGEDITKEELEVVVNRGVRSVPVITVDDVEVTVKQLKSLV